MRLVVMGTASFAVPTLERLHRSRHEIVAVYTQPPRPAGRGNKEQRSAVHERATELGLPVLTPPSLKPPEVRAVFAAHGADLGIVAAYGLLLPAPILAAPRLGCLNLHGSLLPRWRGAAPVERAIEAGDPETGVMVFQMEAGLDTGPVVARADATIGPQATGPALRAELAELGARLWLPLLDDLEAGRARAVPQPNAGVTYAPKLDKAEFALDWQAPAAVLERRIRAFYPLAWLELEGERIRVLAARTEALAGPPGVVLDDRLAVACGNGALRLVEVQRAGKRAMDAASFLRGRPVAAGTVLVQP